MPDFTSAIRSRLSGLSLDPAREAAVVEELSQHATERYDELVTGGAAPEEAFRTVAAELDAGSLPAALASVLPPAATTPPASEPGLRIGSLWKDLAYGARRLRSDPGFSVVAILSLALGIGANTAIFQLLDAVRLRTLPVSRPEELATVRVADPPTGRTGWFSGRYSQITSPQWDRIRQSTQAFSSVAAWSSQRLNRSSGGEAHYADVLWASGPLFETLGVRPLLGRVLSDADDRVGCASGAAVVSEPFWRQEFGASPAALGRTITLEGHPFEIVGVTPASFFGLDVGRRFEVALPLCAEALFGEKTRTKESAAWWLAVVGRLKPGWTISRASADLRTISPATFRATVPPSYDAVEAKQYVRFQLEAESVSGGFSSLRNRYEDPLWLLLGLSGLVLLIACANLANLMVARANVRQREIAVRLALGASRGRLIQQLLAESSVLAAGGALCGAVLAQALSRLLVSSLTTQDVRLFVDLHPDGRLFAFTAGLAAATCLLFGLLPALQAARTQPLAAMKSGGRGIAGSGARVGTRRALVVSQVSLSLVLLVGALLFVRTLRNLLSLDAGFRRDHILVTDVDLAPLKIPVPERNEAKRRLLVRLQAMPGVTSAAQAFIVPASGNGWNENIRIEGSAVSRGVANFNRVSPGYFATMGTPLRAGRDFNDGDRKGGAPAAIVTDTFAKKFLGGANPVGRVFHLVAPVPGQEFAYQVVGLVADSKYSNLREDFSPIVFLPSDQDPEPPPFETYLLRSELPPDRIVSAVKTVLRDTSPAIGVEFHVFETTLREGLRRERLMATLAGVFGLLAAVLAMIGLYGIVSYMAARRRNEIGVRMAMGAGRRDILALILREAGTLLLIGLGVGTALSLVGATSARSMLFGLNPSDPVTLAIAVASLAAVAIAASLLPAHRAANLDPMAALRED